MADNEITIRVGSHDTSAASLDSLKHKLSDLGRMREKIDVNLTGKAALQADEIRLKLDQLGRKIVSPKITLRGVERAELDIARLKHKLDELGRAGGGGNSFQRLLGGLFGGGGGGLPGGPMLALGAPLAALGASLVPGVAGLGIGAGAAGAGVVGVMMARSLAEKQVTKSQTALQAVMNARASVTLQQELIANKGPTPGRLQKLAALQTRSATATAAYADMPSVAEAKALNAQFTPLTNAFEKLKSTAILAFLGSIAPLLRPVTQIFKDMATQVKILQPDLTEMFVASIPFIKAFAGLFVTIAKDLMPAFSKAMTQMVNSGALTLMVKGITLLVQGIAGFITNLGPGMKSSAQIFVGVMTVIGKILPVLGSVFAYMANTFMDNMHSMRLTAHHISEMFDDFRHRTAVVFDGIRHEIAHVWDQIFQNSIGMAIRLVHNIETQFNSVRHQTAVIFDGIRHEVAHVWDQIWNNTVGRVARGISDVVGWVRGLPGRITGAVGKAGSVLTSWGHGVIQGLLNGMTNIIGSVWTFIKGIPGKILQFLGIKSPPQWAIDAGKHIMNGLGIGMTQAKDIMGKAVTASTAQFSSDALAGSVGGGVARWRGLVQKALKMEGLSLQLTDAVLYQMQTESGGRVNAINLTDSNARAGTPSKGLLQVIDPTFRAYHWPGTSGNIYDPLANIAAAINYARHNYGPGLRNAYGGIGTGHGYASGGPASGWAMVGEHGRELVRLPPGSQVYPNGTSESMLSGGGGGGTLVLQIEGGKGAFEQAFIKLIKEYVRITGGGNVQTAFGGRR